MKSDSIGSVLSSVFHAAKYIGLVFVGLAAWLLGREVLSITTSLWAVHPILGVLFLIVFSVAGWWLVGRRLREYMRLPVAVRPPAMPVPGSSQWHMPGPIHARARAVAAYLDNLTHNPRLAGSKPAIDQARRDLLALRPAMDADVQHARETLIRFEHERVDPLLAVIDEEARRIIRNEALGVGVMTALSPSGTADAFLVLWRHANLVLKLGHLYYGRPGLRGNLIILRDVSLAVVVASQAQTVADTAGRLASTLMEHAAATVAGRVVEGVVNMGFTARVGYLAMARCRSFAAFRENSLDEVIARAMAETGHQLKGLTKDLIDRVAVPILKLPMDAAKKVMDWATGLFTRAPRGEASVPG